MNTTRPGAAETPPLRGIRHVALYAPDLESSEAFWTGTMGYMIEWRPDADNVYLTSGSDNLAIHRRKGSASSAAGAATGMPIADPQLDHIGLAVPRPEDVDSWAAHLQSRGVVLAAAAKTHRDGSRSLYFRDPGGVLVQIIHHPPISQ
jgi:catechol 2,3-dioxygenase-like lactoylglutathione lyase family enzyme